MRKIVAAFCDTDEAYRERFAAYLMQHRAKQITLQVFSEPELLVSYLQKNEADVIIAGMGCEELTEADLGTDCAIVKLVGKHQLIQEEIVYDERAKRKVIPVFKYQPMDRILHEIQIVTGIGNEVSDGVLASDLEIIGVISPAGHDMQIPFSLLLAANLSGKKKMLYLNLMQFSGLVRNFHLAGEGNMGDLISRLRKKKLTKEVFLRMTYENEYFSYILPFQNPEQMSEFLLGDFLELLDLIRKQNLYQGVVIDFGTGVGSLADMLEQCHSIYCLTKKGAFYEGQTEDFLQYLQGKGKTRMVDQLHMQEIPFSTKGLKYTSNPIEQLLWSEFGDHVRNCLRGGAEHAG